MICKDCGKIVEDNKKHCRSCESRIYQKMYKETNVYLNGDETDSTYRRTDNIISKKMLKAYKKENPPTFKKGVIGKLQYFYWINKVLFISLTALIVLLISSFVGLLVYNREYNATQIFNMSEPSIVEITSYSESGFVMAIGSGYIIEKNGEILTNYSIIKGANTIKVTLHDTEFFWATHVVGYHYILDLAIIKIDVDNLKTLKISNRATKPGDIVFAMGSSRRPSGFITSGHITRKLKIEYLSCFQITNPVNENNWGGPLINKHGEAVGINWIAYSDGQTNNYAISLYELKYMPRQSLTIKEFYQKDAYYITPIYEIYQNELEPNDSFQEAMVLSQNGTTVKGTFSRIGDIDYYVFTPQKSGVMDVILYPASNYDASYMSLKLFDANEDYMLSGLTRTTRGVRRIHLRTTVVSGQTYFIQVGFKPEYIGLGNYYDLYTYVK